MRLLLLSVSMMSSCWAQQEDSETLAAVKGVVVNSVTGVPVSKAKVYLSTSSKGGPGPSSLSTDSNGQGEFEFTSIAPATYSLWAHRRGYIEGFGKQQTLKVAPAERVTGFKVLIKPQSVLAGRITDFDGEPLQNVLVAAMKRGRKDGHPQLIPVRSILTNDLGEFRIAELPAGRYYVMANNTREVFVVSGNKDTSEKITYPNAYYPGVRDSSSAALIDLATGEVRQGVDFGIAKVPARRITGTIRLARSRMTLTIRRAAPSDTFDWPEPRFTDYDGSFEFRAVPDSYIIYGSSEAGYIRAPLEVGDRDIDGLELTVQPYLMLAGTLRWDGAPPSEARKLRVDLQSLVLQTSQSSAASSEPFQITHLVPGKMRIGVSGLGADDYVKTIRYGNRIVDGETIDLLATGAELEIVLRRGAGLVEGIVENEGGPAVRASVLLIPATNHGAQSLYRQATTGSNGHFEFRGLAPGEYDLYAFDSIDDGSWFDADFDGKYARHAERVKVEENGRESRKIVLIR